VRPGVLACPAAGATGPPQSLPGGWQEQGASYLQWYLPFCRCKYPGSKHAHHQPRSGRRSHQYPLRGDRPAGEGRRRLHHADDVRGLLPLSPRAGRLTPRYAGFGRSHPDSSGDTIVMRSLLSSKAR